MLEGRVRLREPEGESELELGDLVYFPPGPEGAHKVTNGGSERALVAMLSSKASPAVSVYPDSDKVGVWAGEGEARTSRPEICRGRLLARRDLSVPARPGLRGRGQTPPLRVGRPPDPLDGQRAYCLGKLACKLDRDSPRLAGLVRWVTSPTPRSSSGWFSRSFPRLAFNWSWVAQHTITSQLPKLTIREGRRSLGILFGDRRWRFAFLVGLAGWALYIFALRLAPLSLVQAVSAGGLGLLAILAQRAEGAPLPRREWAGVGLAVLGLDLPLRLARGRLERTAVPANWLAVAAWFVGSLVLVAIAVGPAARLLAPGAGWGIAAGLTYAAADVGTKEAVHGGMLLLFIAPVWACHGLAFCLIQLAFQRGRALATAGLSSFCTNALPIVGGIAIFHERTPPGALGVIRVRRLRLRRRRRRRGRAARERTTSTTSSPHERPIPLARDRLIAQGIHKGAHRAGYDFEPVSVRAPTSRAQLRRSALRSCRPALSRSSPPRPASLALVVVVGFAFAGSPGTLAPGTTIDGVAVGGLSAAGCPVAARAARGEHGARPRRRSRSARTLLDPPRRAGRRAASGRKPSRPRSRQGDGSSLFRGFRRLALRFFPIDLMPKRALLRRGGQLRARTDRGEGRPAVRARTDRPPRSSAPARRGRGRRGARPACRGADRDRLASRASAAPDRSRFRRASNSPS